MENRGFIAVSPMADTATSTLSDRHTYSSSGVVVYKRKKKEGSTREVIKNSILQMGEEWWSYKRQYENNKSRSNQIMLLSNFF